jgi:hypothetical protein
MQSAGSGEIRYFPAGHIPPQGWQQSRHCIAEFGWSVRELLLVEMLNSPYTRGGLVDALFATPEGLESSS